MNRARQLLLADIRRRFADALSDLDTLIEAERREGPIVHLEATPPALASEATTTPAVWPDMRDRGEVER